MTIDATDIRDLINNADGRLPYPEDNKLSGTAKNRGESQQDLSEIISRIEAIEAKDEKYTRDCYHRTFQTFARMHHDKFRNYYGCSFDAINKDLDDGEYRNSVISFDYYSFPVTINSVSINGMTAGTTYDIVIPPLKFSNLDDWGAPASTTMVTTRAIKNVNGNPAGEVTDYRYVKCNVNATLNYELELINKTTYNFIVRGIYYWVDILMAEDVDDDPKVYSGKISFYTPVELDSDPVLAPDTNATPTKFNCDCHGYGATFATSGSQENVAVITYTNLTDSLLENPYRE